MKNYIVKVARITTALLLAISTLVLANPSRVSAANPGYIYLSPSSNNLTVGSSFDVQIRIKTTSPINAAFIDYYYDNNGMSVTNIRRGGDFPNQNSATINDTAHGHIHMESTRTTAPYTGDFQFAIITMKSKAVGSWSASISNTSRLVNYPYNNVDFSLGGATFVASAPPVVQPPVVNPPSSTGTPTKTPTGPADTAGGDTASPISEDGLQITEVAATSNDYHNAVITWNTSKPVSSKVNFGTKQDDMSSEQKADPAVTAHSMTLDADSLKAGTHYYFRISANDGSGETLTADNEFDTKAIPVLVKVNDTNNNPAADVSVSVGDTSDYTDTDGQVTLNMPEGEVTILAQKEDFSAQTSSNITLPKDGAVQSVSLTLKRTVSTNSVKLKGKSAGFPWGILLVVPIIGGGAFVLFKKRRAGNVAFTGDALDVERYPVNRPQ